MTDDWSKSHGAAAFGIIYSVCNSVASWRMLPPFQTRTTRHYCLGQRRRWRQRRSHSRQFTASRLRQWGCSCFAQLPEAPSRLRQRRRQRRNQSRQFAASRLRQRGCSCLAQLPDAPSRLRQRITVAGLLAPAMTGQERCALRWRCSQLGCPARQN